MISYCRHLVSLVNYFMYVFVYQFIIISFSNGGVGTGVVAQTLRSSALDFWPTGRAIITIITKFILFAQVVYISGITVQNRGLKEHSFILLNIFLINIFKDYLCLITFKFTAIASSASFALSRASVSKQSGNPRKEVLSIELFSASE